MRLGLEMEGRTQEAENVEFQSDDEGTRYEQRQHINPIPIKLNQARKHADTSRETGE